MSDELAIALADHCDGKWAAENFNETPDGTEPEANRDYWRDLAKVARNQVIRELIEKIGPKASVYSYNRYGGGELEWDYNVADWLKAQMEGE